MPSGPPAFLTFIDLISPCTRSNVITGKDIGHLRGEGGGGGMPESSRVELEENRRPKRFAFSVGELATVNGFHTEITPTTQCLLAFISLHCTESTMNWARKRYCHVFPKDVKRTHMYARTNTLK